MKASEARQLVYNSRLESSLKKEEAKGKIEILLETIKDRANQGYSTCLFVSEYDSDYPVIRKELEDLGYRILTGAAYTEYVDWSR